MKSSVLALFSSKREKHIYLDPQDYTKPQLNQYFPQRGWVEHDPVEIAEAVVNVVRQAISRAQIDPEDVAAIGITNQRETTLVWERDTGRPVANAIVWQDRRTSEICSDIRKTEHSENIRKITGLLVDPYFSATKLMWILNTIPNGQLRAENGELCFGTIDSWLLWNLTEKKSHLTDITNASRTMLFDCKKIAVHHPSYPYP